MRSKTRKISDDRRRNRDEELGARPGRSSSKTVRGPAGTGGPANANKSHERYIMQAQTAEATGDAAATDNLYQHAEHYFRLMRERAV